MNILVCLSRVPDTNSAVELKSGTNEIDTSKIKYVMNPYDEYALEEALLIRTKHGGTITALSVGCDAGVNDILRSAYALAVDKAVFIKLDEVARDSQTVAKAIADFAVNQSFDLIICGRQSIDYASEAVPVYLSAKLNVPLISYVTKLELDNGKAIAEKELDNGTAKLKTSLPCIISVQKGINQPRYPKLPDIMKAKSKKIQEYNVNAKSDKVKAIACEISNKARKGKIVGSSKEEIAEIVNSLTKEEKVL